jgi:hypothetical protein
MAAEPQAGPVAGDPALARCLGANARVHVRQNFSLDRLGREINEIYGELVEKKFGAGD